MHLTVPLSERLRPSSLDQIAGQDHLLGKEGVITHLVKAGRPLSILLWGPPGCGKTTLARLYAKSFEAKFVSISAASGSVSDIKKVIQETQAHPLLSKRLVLFVDEIHRFNKSQQDVFLPLIEEGAIILVGATTENPSFALNSALLSRLQTLTLHPLDHNALFSLIERYENKIQKLPLDQEAREMLVQLSQGDGRHLFNMLETLESIQDKQEINAAKLTTLLQKRAAVYDKAGEGHYNLISSLHKSLRGSDPQASLYWFSRMLEGGEDPGFIARRLVRMATEDIGLADPQALEIALAASRAYDQLGSPEGELALAQAVVYLALSPKSNAIYTAFKEAQKRAQTTTHLPPPKTILNAPTKLMRDMGYGAGYEYDHDTPQAFSGQEYMPEGLEGEAFYHPQERGFEREMKKRLEYFAKLKRALRDQNP